MGIESRDWNRTPATSRHRSHKLGFWVAGALSIGGALLVASPTGRQLLGFQQTRFSGETASHRDVRLSLFPGAPAITVHKASLYPADDRWSGYLADEATCPGAERTDLPPVQQATVMLCLINWARQHAGLSTPPATALLDGTAVQKANEIVRCRNFAHAACGGDPAADIRATGYRGAWGENLYVAGGRWGAPRVALDAWLNSPHHRDNLLHPEWRTQGIAVRKLDEFGAYHDMTLWVSHFGAD